jgi:hypothetical protein
MWDFVMEKSGAGAGFLRELRFVSPANLNYICFSTIIFTITRGWHNRPGSGRSAKSLVKKKQKKKQHNSMKDILRYSRIFSHNFFIPFLAPTGEWGIHETFRITSVS